jgi:hypothetical protein
VATDGHRLSGNEAEYRGDLFTMPRRLIPRKATAVLRIDRFAKRAASYGDDWWRSRYALWREAFRLAAGRGVVVFG